MNNLTIRPITFITRAEMISRILSAFLILSMVLSPVVAKNLTPIYPVIEGASNTDSLGIVLFTKYIIVFELAALMLLAGMICAIVLVHKDMDKKGDVL